MPTFETRGVALGSRIFKIYICVCAVCVLYVCDHMHAHTYHGSCVEVRGNPRHQAPSTLPETESLAVQHSAFRLAGL